MVFAPGKSGNPNGRPRGAKNRPKRANPLEMLEKAAPDIVGKIVSDALAGNPTAQRLCLDRLLAPTRDRTVKFTLGEVDNLKGISKESQRVMRLAAAGKLKPAEVEILMRALAVHRTNVESGDLEGRLDELEARQ